MQSDNTTEGASERPAKLLKVYDSKDHNKWRSLDISNAQLWELEGYGEHWLGEYWEYSHSCTLYRLPNQCWVLVDHASHCESDLDLDPTYKVLTDAQAAEQLLESGYVPPADVIHHVQDKLTPPAPIPPASDPSATEASVDGVSTKGNDIDDSEMILASLGLDQEVKKYGPVGGSCGSEETLFRYPGGHWILYYNSGDPIIGGSSYRALTPAESAEWFLRNGLELPCYLYVHLPMPRQANEITDKEGRSVTTTELETPKTYGPVEIDNGDCDVVGSQEETLYEYPDNRWFLRYTCSNPEFASPGMRPMARDEAANWFVLNGQPIPRSLLDYLPNSNEKSNGQTVRKPPEVAQAEIGLGPPSVKIEPQDQEQLAAMLQSVHGDTPAGRSEPKNGPVHEEDVPTSDFVLTFVPGALVYRGHRESLSGRPWLVLQALAKAPARTMTMRSLQAAVWADTTSGQEAVRSAIKAARRALRAAIQASGETSPADPIPVVDRGTDLTAWRLDLP